LIGPADFLVVAPAMYRAKREGHNRVTPAA
jgi:hypothetical protein